MVHIYTTRNITSFDQEMHVCVFLIEYTTITYLNSICHPHGDETCFCEVWH